MRTSSMAKAIRNMALALVSAGALALAGGASVAAPQALGLVASAGPVPLTCLGPDCAVEFSAFCLQQERRPPELGEKYALVEEGVLTLVGERADGGRVTLDAGREIAFSALRTHVAVRLSMSSHRFDALGLVKAFVAVEAKAVLLPVPKADDPSPFSKSEIALVTGVLRDTGDKLVDGDTVRMSAARMTLAAVNGLGDVHLISKDRREILYDSVIQEHGKATPAEGRALFDRAFQGCGGTEAYMLAPPSFKGCLQSKHDGFLGTLNADYWDAIRTGS